jgi:hypothetical protein
MAKKQQPGSRGMVPFFVAKFISKLFELLFMTKKQQPGSRGMVPFLSPNLFQNFLNYFS